MSYVAFNDWAVEKAEEITGLHVIANPTATSEVYPYLSIEVSDNVSDEAKSTNRRIFRTYNFKMKLVVAANNELQSNAEVEETLRIYADQIIEKFDNVDLRHPGNVAARAKLLQGTVRTEVNTVAQRVMEFTLSIYKLS
jgi:hypothetical protein